MSKVLMISLLLLLSGCYSPSSATEALKDAGYSNIEIKGRSWFGCSSDDAFATKFKAINSSGRTVNGSVCSGYLKGSTIRY